MEVVNQRIEILPTMMMKLLQSRHPRICQLVFILMTKDAYGGGIYFLKERTTHPPNHMELSTYIRAVKIVTARLALILIGRIYWGEFFKNLISDTYYNNPNKEDDPKKEENPKNEDDPKNAQKQRQTPKKCKLEMKTSKSKTT